MYGLTDNIVAGPAGHITAGPAGHFEAGPSGGFTPGPAGHVPISEGGWVPISEGGHVPIDCTPALIPYAAPSGGVTFMEGSTQSPIPSTGGGHGPVSQGGGGAQYLLGGGGVSGSGSGGSSGGGGVSAASGGGVQYLLGGGGGVSGSGGGGYSGGGGGSGYSGGGGGVSGSGGVGFSGGGGGGGGAGGGGMLYTSFSGAGMGPVELRVGQALGQATGTIQPSPATEGFTVSPGGRTVPTPTGYVHPPQASHFHGQPQTHVAHHPTQVFTHLVTTEAWQGYQAAYVWDGRPEGAPPPPFLAGDYVKPSSYDPPRVMFSDEKPGAVPMVDASVGGPHMQVNDVTNLTVNQDYGQTSTVQYSSNTLNERSITFDNSETRNQTVNMPENRQATTNIDMSQTNNADLSTNRQETTQINVEDAARVLNMFFLDAPSASPANVTLGGGIMAHVA